MKHRIKENLIERNVTQRELAERTGMTEAGISKMITRGEASVSSIRRVADALGVDVGDLSVQEPVLKAKFGSDKTPLKIGELELPCYVLEDGTRVFSGRGMQKAIGSAHTSGTWFSSFVCSSPISGILSEIETGETNALYKMQHPVKFTRNTAGGSQSDTYGYEATLLIDLCDAIIKAGEMGAEIPSAYQRNASAIIRAVAKTGIIALVDEATGYDKEKSRAKDELQKMLNSFLRDEAARWVKQFDDQFFEDIYKMRHWNWEKTSKRPGVVGTWIKEIVYDRLAPILPELERRNPKKENGGRAYRHHQFLSREVGLPRLKQHLEAVHAIAVISNYDWYRFNIYLDKAYPRNYSQLYLDFEFEE